MALVDREVIRKDPAFQNQVRIALGVVSFNYMVEVPSGTDTDKKKLKVLRDYAEDVLRFPENYVPRFCLVAAGVLTDQQLSSGGSPNKISDAELLKAVKAGFAAFANVESKWPFVQLTPA